MSEADVTLSTEGYLQVSGVLSFATVIAMRYRGASLLKKSQEAVFDLSAVMRCDSSALALLTAWTREAKKLGKHARFIRVPIQLMDIARLSRLQEVLSLQE